MLRSLKDLLLPQECWLCHRGHDVLCFECQRLWSKSARLCAHIGRYRVFAVRPYDSLSAQVIVGAKDHHRRWLLPLLSAAITQSVVGLISESSVPPDEKEPLILAPVPSRSESIRRRGDDVVLHVTRNVAKELERVGVRARALTLFRYRRKVKDQSGLNLHQRQRNLEGAFALTRPDLRGSGVIVVDDVITSGSSMREAFRALEPSGAAILGGACAAATSLWGGQAL